MKQLFVFAGLAALAITADGQEIDLGQHADDLEVSIRPHSDVIVFGDPLFVEVTLVNRGKEVIRARRLSEVHLQIFAFEPESRIEIECTDYGAALLGGTGYGGAPGEFAYLPNEPTKIIAVVHLPRNIKYLPKSIDDLGHPFWRRFVGGGALRIRCVYHLSMRLCVAGSPASIHIKPRIEKEIASLQERAEYDKRSGDTTILPGDFGFIGLDGLRTRVQTANLAGRIKSGELAGILTLTRLMEQLKYDDDIDRDQINKEVVEWVAAQPDIKREWFARRLSGANFQRTLSAATLGKLREFAKDAK